MIDLLRYALVVEILGVGFLPVALWLFRRLPDRGYIFAKMLGLAIVTYGTWLVGSVVPVASSVALPLVVLLAGVAACWWFLHAETIVTIRELRKIIVIEETLFLLALVVWSVFRAQVFHPGIGHTEQYMDMSLLGASLHAASYPPYDPWMSGHTINYYYVGYLMFGLLIKLAGVAPSVGYNLAISLLFAFAVTGAYSLGYALTRHWAWSTLSAGFVALVGNWHAVLVQLPAHDNPATTYYWFWPSTRVIGANTTITEFPFFSFMLGDLHPHVMSFPLVLLALAFGCNILLSPDPLRLRKEVSSLLPLAVLAMTIGMLFSVNSWDFPTYLMTVAVCIAVQAYLTEVNSRWWVHPLKVIGAVAAASLVLYMPFYLHFRSPTHGLGLVSTPSDLLEFIQVMGILLLPAILLLGALALLFQPASEAEEPTVTLPASSTPVSEAGSTSTFNALQIGTYTILFVGALLAAHYHLWVVILMCILGGASLFVLYRVVNTEEPSRRDTIALVFILMACLMIVIPEVVYVRDSFDGSGSYRMNTLFKLYYQAWTLLGVVGAYAVYRGWSVLRRYFSPAYAWGAATLIALGTLGGLYYTFNAPQSANQGGLAQSLDGASLLQANAPGDYAATQWLNQHAPQAAVVLEGTGGEYDTKFARISTFTGLPTVMGWAGHEFQWRGADPEIQRRVDDIKTIYTTSNSGRAQSILRHYGVRYVVVGATEHQAYPGPGLTKFTSFMRPAFTSTHTTVYTWK